MTTPATVSDAAQFLLFGSPEDVEGARLKLERFLAADRHWRPERWRRRRYEKLVEIARAALAEAN